MKNNKGRSEKRIRRFGVLAAFVLSLFFGGTSSFAAEINQVEKPQENEVTLYKDVFDQAFYSEALNQLDLGRWVRKIFRKTVPSANVNIFDEVPDSTFFTNRQGRQRLSTEDLEKGACETEGPDVSRPLTLIAAEQQGLRYGFVVEDAKKDQYILRFDLQSHPELNTGAEVVASRFYHAIGYNTPQYTVFFFKPEQLEISPDAITFDNTGFVKKLTRNILDRYFTSIPQTADGFYRASADKVLPGKEIGEFSFMSRRKNDPDDPVNHRDRREIRALGIFAAWLNDYGVYENNTYDMLVTGNGKNHIKHYLADFTHTLGASTEGAKPPMVGYEYMADYGETFKTILALGLREKPWQKQWREAGEKQHPLPAVGYFSNEGFNPAKYKTELPYEAFRMVTRADGLWAAKILASFSDEDIRAMVKAGQYTDARAMEHLVQTLIERRDLIARYWFSQGGALDSFGFSNGKISFKDLAVDHGFEKQENTSYSVEVFTEGRKKEIAKFTSTEPGFSVDPSWTGDGRKAEITIRVRRVSSPESPLVKLLLDPGGICGIRHED